MPPANTSTTKSNTTGAASAAPKTPKEKVAKVTKPRDTEMIRALLLTYVDGRVTETAPARAVDVERAVFGRVRKETEADFAWLQQNGLIKIITLGGRIQIILPNKRSNADTPLTAVGRAMNVEAQAAQIAAQSSSGSATATK